MTALRSVLDAPEARRFLAVATEYCTLMERAPAMDRSELLPRLERLLPRLYLAGAELPSVEPGEDEGPVLARSVEDERRMQAALAEVLGSRDAYRAIFNPVDRDHAEPVTALLSQDLAEIHGDLREALMLTTRRSASDEDVLWEWREAFGSHWSHHAASALCVVNALVRTEFAHLPDVGAETGAGGAPTA